MTYTKDCSLRPNRKTRDAELTRKELIASFPGTSFMAEREGDTLNVYLVSGDGIEHNALMDRAPGGRMTAAKLQRQNEAARKAGRI